MPSGRRNSIGGGSTLLLFRTSHTAHTPQFLVWPESIYDRHRLPSSKHRDYVNYIYGTGGPTQKGVIECAYSTGDGQNRIPPQNAKRCHSVCWVIPKSYTQVCKRILTPTHLFRLPFPVASCCSFSAAACTWAGHRDPCHAQHTYINNEFIQMCKYRLIVPHAHTLLTGIRSDTTNSWRGPSGTPCRWTCHRHGWAARPWSWSASIRTDTVFAPLAPWTRWSTVPLELQSKTKQSQTLFNSVKQLAKIHASVNRVHWHCQVLAKCSGFGGVIHKLQTNTKFRLNVNRCVMRVSIAWMLKRAHTHWAWLAFSINYTRPDTTTHTQAQLFNVYRWICK